MPIRVQQLRDLILTILMTGVYTLLYTFECVLTYAMNRDQVKTSHSHKGQVSGNVTDVKHKLVLMLYPMTNSPLMFINQSRNIRCRVYSFVVIQIV